MMRIVRLACVAALGVLLVSCGSNDAEVQQYAKAKGMSKDYAAAFAVCAADFRRSKPRFIAKDGQTLMKSVPYEICDCQSKTIISVFKPDQYASHTTFAEYMAKEKRKQPPRFSKKVLRDGNLPKEAGPKLERAFKSCVDTYKSANKNKPEMAELFEFIPPAPPKPQETAEASH